MLPLGSEFLVLKSLKPVGRVTPKNFKVPVQHFDCVYTVYLQSTLVYLSKFMGVSWVSALAAKSPCILCGARPGLHGGLVLHSLTSCEDLALTQCKPLIHIIWILVRYRRMYRDDLEVYSQCTDNILW